jgi:YebC/PmpR family DNA-binding regulatory protein
MSGHSKWSTIKHKKAVIDAKRGKIFTKLVKEITVAAREGGGNPDMNPRLRLAMDTAKGQNMPADNVERAIKKGTGELPGQEYSEITYEGYGPHSVAILVETLTDNKNRTAPELRTIFSKKNGLMGAAGCVAWMFERKGILRLDASVMEEDALMDLVLDAGAEDFQSEDGFYEITTEVADFINVKNALNDKDIACEIAELAMIPKDTLKLEDPNHLKNILALIEAIEENDDVQNVYSNFDADPNMLEQLE